jgi:hypothetical protein
LGDNYDDLKNKVRMDVSAVRKRPPRMRVGAGRQTGSYCGNQAKDSCALVQDDGNVDMRSSQNSGHVKTEPQDLLLDCI